MKQSQLFRKKTVEHILQESEKVENGAHLLNRTLNLRDLTAMGIAAIIGAGIFSTIGNASFSGGPAVILLFVFVAIACAFSAMSYAEFASSIPISGSAYTYAYASFGELLAWIIGWALIVEYAIGNIVVAISWSDYFTTLLAGMQIHIPEFFCMDYLTAKAGYSEYLIKQSTVQPISPALKEQFMAWTTAPELLNLKIIMDLPAISIVIAISALIYIGVHQARTASNIFVGIKLMVIVLVIIVGAFYVNPDNWNPFMPNGMNGVLQGVSSVFFAYIGFDALATTAEECKNPRRDLPKSMIASLVICTVLYILISLTLTGMVNYKDLAVGDPLAFVFGERGVGWMKGIVAVSAVIAMASVLLVFQNGQPRIWMSMSRDGLLPKQFQKIHPKFQTPSFATIVAGILVAVPALFLQDLLVTDLTSIGTLFAFALVGGGVILLPKIAKEPGKFHLPFINGRFIIPILTSIYIYFFWNRIQSAFLNIGNENYQEILFLLFILLAIIMTILTVLKEFSVIPVLAVLFCSYLMIEIPAKSWLVFFGWMGVGLTIYFLYGYRKSKLSTK